MDKQKVFAEGMRFEKPREGSPDFIKGRLSFEVDSAIEFLKKYKNEKGWVNVDLKKSESKGVLYLELNDWKPNTNKPTFPTDEIDVSQIPF